MKGEERMPEEDEVSLYDYIKVIAKRKWLIIAGTLVCIAIAGIVTLLLPRVYETRASLTMEGPDTPDVKMGVLNIPTGLSFDKFFNFLPIDRDLDLKVITKLGLDKSPDNLTPQALGQMITFSRDKPSRMITVRVRYSHPGKAKDIANTMGEEVKEHYQVLNTLEISQSQNLVDEQLSLAQASLVEVDKDLQAFEETVDVDSLKKEIQSRSCQETKLTEEYSKIRVSLVEEEAGLARAEGEIQKTDEQLSFAQASLLEVDKDLQAFKETVDVDSLKKEIQSRSSQETKLTEEYSKIRVSLVEEEAGLARAQDELQKQDRFYVLSKSIVEDPAYGRILDKLPREDIADFQRVKGESQQINPVYLNLQQRVTNARISIAGEKAKQALFKERIEENRLVLSKLRAQLAEKEAEWKRLTEVHNRAKGAFLEAKIEENRLALSKLRAQLAEKEPEWEDLLEAHDLTKKDYQGIRSAHRGASKLLAAAKARQLKTVAAAGVPSRPMEPKTKRILLVAAALGLLAVLLLAFFLEYLEKMRRVETESKRQEE